MSGVDVQPRGHIAPLKAVCLRRGGHPGVTAALASMHAQRYPHMNITGATEPLFAARDLQAG